MVAVSDSQPENEKRRASLISVAAVLVLIVLKVAVGLLTGSLGVLAPLEPETRWQKGPHKQASRGAIFRIVGVGRRRREGIRANQCERWLLLLGGFQ